MEKKEFEKIGPAGSALARDAGRFEESGDEECHSKTEWHRVVAWNGLGEYAATKLRKGDHIYVEGTLVSSTYEKEYGKGKNKITVPHKAWQVKADSIRKLNRNRKDQVPYNAPLDVQGGRFLSKSSLRERAAVFPGLDRSTSHCLGGNASAL